MNHSESSAINYDKLMPRTNLVDQAHKLAGKVTGWTRGKIDQSGIMELQESANELSETTLRYEDQMHNAESDLHCKILARMEQVRKQFEALKKREVVERVEDIIRALREEKEENCSLATVGIAILLHKKIKDNYESPRDQRALQIIGVQNLPMKENFLEDLLKNKDEFNKKTTDLKAHYLEATSDEKNTDGRTIIIGRLLQELYTAEMANRILEKYNELLKNIRDPGKKISWDKVEQKIEKDLPTIIKALPKFHEKIQEKVITFTSDENKETWEEKVKEIERWIEKNTSAKGTKLEIQHDFISEEERERLIKENGKADYGDYVKMNVTAQNGKFNVFLSEMLGIRSISRNPSVPVHFKLTPVTENNSLANIKRPWDRDENFYHTLKVAAHIDGEYRQYQAEFNAISKAETQSLVDSVLALFSEA